MGSTMVPSVGRIVHYRMTEKDGNGSAAGEIRAAMIIKVSATPDIDQTVNLQVAVNGTDDGFLPRENLVWKKGVAFGDEPGQWNWPKLV